MNFDDERFVKIYPRNTTNWKLLGWEGRCVLMMLLREVDRAGCLDIEGGMEGLALLLDLPPDVTERGFASCVKRGSVVQNGNTAIIPNFVKAQEARQTDRVRQAESRARRRELGMMSQIVTNDARTVTDCDQTSHAVTASHTPSHDVTLRREQIRSEENRSELLPKTPAQRDVSPGQGSLALSTPPEATKPKPARKPKEPKPTDPTPGSVIFASYREAFLQRYGVEPPRDSRTNRHFSNVARNASVGRSAACSEPDAIKEACAVAARYVRHPDALYAKQQHPPGLLERDWHKLVTEYRTGRTITATTARDHERTASNPILEYAAELRAQEEAAKRRKAEVINVDE